MTLQGIIMTSQTKMTSSTGWVSWLIWWSNANSASSAAAANQPCLHTVTPSAGLVQLRLTSIMLPTFNFLWIYEHAWNIFTYLPRSHDANQFIWWTRTTIYSFENQENGSKNDSSDDGSKGHVYWFNPSVTRFETGVPRFVDLWPFNYDALLMTFFSEFIGKCVWDRKDHDVHHARTILTLVNPNLDGLVNLYLVYLPFVWCRLRV